MNILDLKASDLGGAVGHVAASQLYIALTEDDENTMGPRTWFGSDPDDGGGIEQDVLDMARYVNGRDIPAETLWRWAAMNGIVINEGEDYQAVPLARRLAFEIFTDTCTRAHHRIELAQLAASKLIPLGEAADVPGLKLEDSIFEPHGSLGDQEEFQKQWLKDQEAVDRRALEEASDATAEALPGQSLGEPIDDDQEKPAGLSAGVMEGTNNAEDPANEGQAVGDAPPADPAAQGSVSEVADDGLSKADSAGEDGPAGNAEDHATGGEKLADALAEPAGSEAGTHGPADGALAVVEGEAGVVGDDAVVVNAKKSRKGKSTS